MSPILTSLSALVGSWAFLSGAIWKLSERAESVVTDDGKLQMANWLRGVNPALPFRSWSKSFEVAFDSVFGKKHFTWRCFFRSCLASFLSVFAVSLLWWILRPADFTSFLHGGGLHDGWWILLLSLLITNVIPDYFSLLESRYVIKRISQSSSYFQVVLWLLGDLIITATIAIVSFSIFIAFYTEYLLGWFSEGLWKEFLNGIDLIFELGIPLKPIEDGDITPGLFFYSTFFTSTWVILHSLSMFLIKISNVVGHFTSKLKVILNIDEKPFLSVAIVMIIILTVVHLAMIPFAL